MNYPRFLQDLLNHCPPAGAGVHPWLFKVARYLHRYHSPDEIQVILEARVSGCGRCLEPHEISDAIRNSGSHVWRPSGKTASQRRAEWIAAPTSIRVPVFNPEEAAVAASRVPIEITSDWLKEHSPCSVDCSTAEFLRLIFVSTEKTLLFCHYQNQGRLYPDEVNLEKFTSIHFPLGAWFLCNPVDGLSHFNPRLNRKSRRSEESLTSFRYAVLECDREPRTQWLKILVGLSLPIVAITHSAGRSDHALVRVNCASKTAWNTFKVEQLRPLVELGADDGALSAVRLTRLPGCFRGEHRQELLYLNPAANGSSIFNL
jgi:hypothetical protein